ncbi:MAG: Uma2 family endonuclease [Oscillospiraceae bacterium]|nr:Uma2 family endonuclease [Oscillospiraceae bacterium]
MEKINYPDNKEFYKKELIDGKIVFALPARMEHSNIVLNVYDLFKDYFRKNRNYECKVYPDNIFLYIEDKQKLIPDVMVICDTSKFTERGYEGVPDLVVEVISKSTFDYDYGRKKEIYEQIGVKEFWIINPYSKEVIQYILKDGKFKFLGGYFVGEEQDDWSGGSYSSEILKVYIFPELEIKITDLFDFK